MRSTQVPLGHPGPRSGPSRQPALGDQLVVHPDDGVAGDPQIGGEATTRRQHRARDQCTGSHRLPQRGFQAPTDLLPVDLEMHVHA